ncbi:ATP-dependent helicase [Rhodovibrio salinarum]|uniref:DNA 3'-5' helicase n=1 Tax=Rhodovibrio salinarum TaxID=1087 RepID=A0A934QFY9_9PROT|nr:ATP-dependent helicase [Rhodovibrio salinarum]MBK1696246.1 ATP-dependent helicase [Rhodovibrio salinarum]
MSKPAERDQELFTDLNDQQRAAVFHGLDAVAVGEVPSPLLIVAGAGTGKTKTLTARVANLILNGADPGRILLCTFTRRAAADMTRRAQAICAEALGPRAVLADGLDWAGTFHATANRLLRAYAHVIGLAPNFTVLDRGDAEDLMNLVREDLGFSGQHKRFPKKGACLAIYSRTVNKDEDLETVLHHAFPQYADWVDELRGLFRAYADTKERRDLLDYDDLLQLWAAMMAEPDIAEELRGAFDHVLVDEYQDTNPLQARILQGLCPNGRGLTVVGDDAQSIFAFRGAEVRNILDFAHQFDPPAQVVTLEENYRSSQPILTATNAIIAQAAEGHRKELRSTKCGGDRPKLVTARDERAQVDYVCGQILAAFEAGTRLQDQAVLVRTGWHSGPLEIELARRNIPFVKYGGLKFLEAAHVKDLVALLRWAENPRDEVAGFRTLQLLPGIGPTTARKALAGIQQHATAPIADTLDAFTPPPAARDAWPDLLATIHTLESGATPWPSQPGIARDWYATHLERLHENPAARMRDLEQLEQIAAGYPSRGQFLSEVALDPPEATGDDAGAPNIDDDYLILSTIHSAKGQEWSCVYVLNCTDGCIPSDMSTGTVADIEEERRLLYVAATRAKNDLHLIHPQRFYRTQQAKHGDGYVTAPVSRFLPASVQDHFSRKAVGTPSATAKASEVSSARSRNLRAVVKSRWS